MWRVWRVGHLRIRPGVHERNLALVGAWNVFVEERISLGEAVTGDRALSTEALLIIPGKMGDGRDRRVLVLML